MDLPTGERAAWQAALGGDGEAFATVFDLHRQRVFRHVARLTPDAYDAEDVTAGAFLELWRRRRAVRLVDGSVLPWLLVTATNLARNRSRGLRRYRALLSALPRSADVRSADELAMDQIEEADLVERIRRALRSLRPADAALIVLTVFEHYSDGDAAIALGISDGAARTRLHRARRRLAAVLDAVDEYPLTKNEEECR